MNNLIEGMIFLVKALGLSFVIILLIGLIIATLRAIFNSAGERMARIKVLGAVNSLSDKEVEELIKRYLEDEE